TIAKSSSSSTMRTALKSLNGRGFGMREFYVRDKRVLLGNHLAICLVSSPTVSGGKPFWVRPGRGISILLRCFAESCASLLLKSRFQNIEATRLFQGRDFRASPSSATLRSSSKHRRDALQRSKRGIPLPSLDAADMSDVQPARVRKFLLVLLRRKTILPIICGAGGIRILVCLYRRYRLGQLARHIYRASKDVGKIGKTALYPFGHEWRSG